MATFGHLYYERGMILSPLKPHLPEHTPRDRRHYHRPLIAWTRHLPSILIVALLCAAHNMPGQATPRTRQKSTSRANTPPQGFMDLKSLIPGISLDIKYHTRSNFTGAPLPGYGIPGAWLRTKAALALANVYKDLKRKGYGLRIFDAYRPRRATLAMLAWAKRSGNYWQVTRGYISPTSNHNKGTAVDLTLVSLKTGKPLDMGTSYDSASPRSHTLNCKGGLLRRRLILKKAMERHGFRNFRKEWWHYTYRPLKNAKPRDVPYACFEPAEGRFKPPAGWSNSRYKPPLTFSRLLPCR